MKTSQAQCLRMRELRAERRQKRRRPGCAPGLLVTNSANADQLMAKQYNLPAPPVALSEALLQPWLICAAFHEMLPPPVRSIWPSIARARSGGTFALLPPPCAGIVMPSDVQ